MSGFEDNTKGSLSKGCAFYVMIHVSSNSQCQEQDAPGRSSLTINFADLGVKVRTCPATCCSWQNGLLMHSTIVREPAKHECVTLIVAVCDVT